MLPDPTHRSTHRLPTHPRWTGPDSVLATHCLAPTRPPTHPQDGDGSDGEGGGGAGDTPTEQGAAASEGKEGEGEDDDDLPDGAQRMKQEKRLKMMRKHGVVVEARRSACAVLCCLVSLCCVVHSCCVRGS